MTSQGPESQPHEPTSAGTGADTALPEAEAPPPSGPPGPEMPPEYVQQPPPPMAPPPPPAAAYPPQPQRSSGKILAGALAIALVAGGAGGAIGYFAADRTELSPSPSTSVSDGTISQVATDVSPSVVAIMSGSGEGSGVVYSDEGYIITNNHVVAGASDLNVRFIDGSTQEASLVGADPSQDLAVIQVEDTAELEPVDIGESSSTQVGDLVLAIGSPLGLEGTVTSGIVSALDRSINVGGETDSPQDGEQTTLEGLIQTDAAINMGNSGGALVNGNGELIGINTAIASTEMGSIGLGFAIPSETAQDVADQIIETGSVEQPFIGVSVADVEDGAMVLRVMPDSPAAAAGLEPGDIITNLDDEEIAGGADVRGYISNTEPGDTVEVTYVRGGSSETVTVDVAAQQEGN